MANAKVANYHFVGWKKPGQKKHLVCVFAQNSGYCKLEWQKEQKKEKLQMDLGVIGMCLNLPVVIILLLVHMCQHLSMKYFNKGVFKNEMKGNTT